MKDSAVLEQEITQLFADVLSLEVPSPETDLFDTGLLDSLSFVELLARLEKRFGTKVSLEDLEIDHFRSITRIASFVRERGANGAGKGGVGEGNGFRA